MRGSKPKSSTGKSDDATPAAGMYASGTMSRRVNFSFIRNRTVMIVAAAVILVAAVSAYILTRQPSYAGKVCDASIATKSSDPNLQTNVIAFGSLANTVQSKAHYTKDPDCMYIVAQYQIAIGASSLAQTTISQLKSTYGSGYVFEKGLDSGHASIQSLQSQLDTMKNAQDNTNGKISPGI